MTAGRHKEIKPDTGPAKRGKARVSDLPSGNAVEKEMLWRSWFPKIKWKAKGMSPEDTERLLEAFRLFCLQVKIRHPEHGKIPFVLRDAQVETARLWISEQKVVNLKARQIGFSTLAAVFMLWVAMGWDDKQVLALSKGEREAIKLLLKSKLAYRTLPEWAVERGPKLLNKVSTSMAFDNDSVIESLPSGSNPARGEAAFLVILDEWAFLLDPHAAWASIEPTIDIGGRCIAISTANGEGNFFHELWLNAKAGINGFVPVFWPWSASDTRDEGWYEQKKLELAAWQLRQEYPANDTEAFVGSGNPVFNLDVLAAKEVHPPLRSIHIESHRKGQFTTHENGDFHIWEEPDPKEAYAIGADTSQGLAHGDYTVVAVLKVSDGNIAAVYRGKIDPDVLGEKVLPGIGYMYNTGLVCPEINNMGLSTLKGLQRAQYTRLYRRRTQAKRQDLPTESMGWYTSGSNKPDMITEVARWLRDHNVPYATMLGELRTYVRDKNGKMSGSPNDDCVMGLAVALQAVQYCHLNPIRSQLPTEYGNSIEFWDKKLTAMNRRLDRGASPNTSRSRKNKQTVLTVGRSFDF